MPIIFSKKIETPLKPHSFSFIQDDDGLIEVRAYYGKGDYHTVVSRLLPVPGVEYIIQPERESIEGENDNNMD